MKRTIDWLEIIFEQQAEFQRLLGNEVPVDNPEMLGHHLLGLITEVGEVAQADKRWKKNGRNKHYDKEEKLMELADVMVFLVNICLYSDIPAEHLASATIQKIRINTERYKGGSAQ